MLIRVVVHFIVYGGLFWGSSTVATPEAAVLRFAKWVRQ